jgi:Tat protein translocase TatB subunit
VGIGDIGWSEFLFLLALALILLGPRRLPEVANALGRGLREFRRALNEVQEELRRETQWTAWTEDWSPARGTGATADRAETTPPRAALPAKDAEPEEPGATAQP